MSEPLTQAERRQIILKTAALLIENYAYPDLAQLMATHVQELLDEDHYEDCEKPSKFGAQLTEDLRAISKDRHLLVGYSPQLAAELEQMGGRSAKGEEYESHWWAQVHSDNFGIPRVEYLPGNIGYIELRYFAPANLAGEVAVNAMNFLSRCDALIFDLRGCGGGDPFMVQLFESYLYSKDQAPKLLISKYKRHLDRSQQIWTLPFVPGRRLPDIPVYILTSRRTFSGGEDLAYTMKHHGRAVIVGDRTGGGAHPVESMSISNGFVLIVPNEYPTHPVTGSNWEGTGVEPDIAVLPEVGLRTAHLHALDTLIKKSKSEERTHRLEWYKTRVNAQYQPFQVDYATLERYIGEYRDYKVKLVGDNLVLIEKVTGAEWLMTPISESTFTADDDYNARFEVDQAGQTTAITWIGRDSQAEITVNRTDLHDMPE